MKIAVYHDLPSGGAKRALYEMLIRLREKHELILFTHEGNEDYLSLEGLVHKVEWLKRSAKQSRVKVITSSLIGGSMVTYEAQQRDISSLIDRAGADVTFVHASQSVQNPSVLKYTKTPIVYFSQEVRRAWYEKRLREMIPVGRLGKLRLRIQKQAAELGEQNIAAAQHILVNSYYSHDAHKIAYGCESRVLYLGVNTGDFMLKHKQRPALKDPKHLLVVGGLERFKNQVSVVKAAECLYKEYKTSTVVHFVFDRFDPKYRNEVESAAQQASVHIELHERVEQSRLQELYAQADAVICVADLEPFGFTPLEAMACGTPVVAIREAGYRETVIDGVNGVFSENIHPDVLADAIDRCLRAGFEPQELRAHVRKHWSWDRTVKGLENILQDVANEKA